jgi:hypothetical protein
MNGYPEGPAPPSSDHIESGPLDEPTLDTTSSASMIPMPEMDNEEMTDSEGPPFVASNEEVGGEVEEDQIIPQECNVPIPEPENIEPA